MGSAVIPAAGVFAKDGARANDSPEADAGVRERFLQRGLTPQRGTLWAGRVGLAGASLDPRNPLPLIADLKEVVGADEHGEPREDDQREGDDPRVRHHVSADAFHLTAARRKQGDNDAEPGAENGEGSNGKQFVEPRLLILNSLEPFAYFMAQILYVAVHAVISVESEHGLLKSL
jgi:hypothetical protein